MKETCDPNEITKTEEYEAGKEAKKRRLKKERTLAAIAGVIFVGIPLVPALAEAIKIVNENPLTQLEARKTIEYEKKKLNIPKCTNIELTFSQEPTRVKTQKIKKDLYTITLEKGQLKATEIKHQMYYVGNNLIEEKPNFLLDVYWHNPQAIFYSLFR